MGGETTAKTPLDVTPEQPMSPASGANLPQSTLEVNDQRDSFAGNPSGYHEHMQRISGPQTGGWSDPNFKLTDAGTTTAGAPAPVSFAPSAPPPEQGPTRANVGNFNPSTALGTLTGQNVGRPLTALETLIGQNVGRPLTAIDRIIGEVAGGLEAYPRFSTIPSSFADAVPLGCAQTGFPTNGIPGGWEGLVGGPVLDSPAPLGVPSGLGTLECPPQTPECPPPSVNGVVADVPGRVDNLPVLGNSYTIAKGDNLTYIARQALGVNDGEPDPVGLQNVIDTIAQGNSIKNENLIFAGASLTINDGMIKSALSPAKPCDKITAQTPPVPEESQPTAPPGNGQPIAPPADGQPIAQPGVGASTIL
jgi:hypothetical protein